MVGVSAETYRRQSFVIPAGFSTGYDRVTCACSLLQIIIVPSSSSSGAKEVLAPSSFNTLSCSMSRRQEAGGRRQEAGVRRQEAGSRRQKAEGRRQ